MASDEMMLGALGRAGAPGQRRGFSERVMGGVSQERVMVETIAGPPCLRPRGDVATTRLRWAQLTPGPRKPRRCSAPPWSCPDG